DPEATIFRFVGRPVGQECGGGHGLASLRVRDVEAGDRPWHVWQLQDLLELVQCIWSPSRGSVAEQLTLLEEVTGVLRRQLDEAYLVATSGNQRTNRSPRAAPQPALEHHPVLELQRQEDLGWHVHRRIQVPR